MSNPYQPSAPPLSELDRTWPANDSVYRLTPLPNYQVYNPPTCPYENNHKSCYPPDRNKCPTQSYCYPQQNNHMSCHHINNGGRPTHCHESDHDCCSIL